jgi:putative transposase
MESSRRLIGYDYRSAGSYFVTICTDWRQLLFVKPEVIAVVEGAWSTIPDHFDNVKTDVFVVMPNHVHGIIVITDSVVPQHAADGGARVPSGSISAVVRSFKAAVTRELRARSLIEGPVWQRNYWDRVIRDEDELNRIRQYIAFNPIAWEFDHDNPLRNADAEYEKAWSWLERLSESVRSMLRHYKTNALAVDNTLRTHPS